MIKQLVKLANHLDEIGLAKEANYLDKVIKESARGRSEYPQAFRQWVRNRILDGKLGVAYQKALRDYDGEKMRRSNAWLKGSFPPPRGAAALNIKYLKEQWELSNTQAKEPEAPTQEEPNPPEIDLDPNEVRQLADLIEQKQDRGEQLSLF
jgi:hypothetical protein